MAILRLKNQAQNLFIIIFQNTAMDTWISTSIKLLFIRRSTHVIMKKLRHGLLMTQVYDKPRSSKHFLVFALKDSRGQGKSCIENKLRVRHLSQLSWLQTLFSNHALPLPRPLNLFKFFAPNHLKEILSALKCSWTQTE